MVSTNPFTPSFGVKPPLLVGRDQILDEFDQGLIQGLGALERSALVVGPRGSGKSVMLAEFEDVAAARGWLTIRETAVPGLIDRLINEHLPRQLLELDPHPTSHKLKGLGAMGVSASWESSDDYRMVPGLQTLIETLCEVLAIRTAGAGLVLSVDEVHGADARDELRLLGAVFQVVRSNHDIAFTAAGLPSGVTAMLNVDVLTFLRRGARYQIAGVEPVEASYALHDPLIASGRTITDEALDYAARASRGYPFLVQLIGSQLCRNSQPGDEIGLPIARRGAALAVPLMRRLVHEPALSDVSPEELRFLAAMRADAGPSRRAELQQRLGITHDSFSQYRDRLIAAELITPAGRGYLEYVIPYLGDTAVDMALQRRAITETSGIDHFIGPPQEGADRRNGPEIT